MAESKGVFSVFRPFHDAVFDECPYHEWVQGEAQAKTEKDRRDREDRERLDSKITAEKDRLRREVEAKDIEKQNERERERKNRALNALPTEPVDETRIPTMTINPLDPKLIDVVMPDPEIYLIRLDDFVAHGRLPIFPEKVVKLSDINLRSSFLVYLSHAWIELPGKTVSRRIVRKVVEKKKVEVGDFYFDGVIEESSDEEEAAVIERPPTPEGCAKGVTTADNFSHGKWELYCQALRSAHREFAPEMENVFVWMDVCCVPKSAVLLTDPKDPDVTIGQQLNEDSFNKWSQILFSRTMHYMDCMLTCVLDDEFLHAPWQLANSGQGLHKDYKAKAWHRYLSRRWCRVEMGYCANIPLPTEEEYQHHAVFDRRLNPLVGKAVMRTDKLAGGLLYERLQARRAHLLYGTREQSLRAPPIVLPRLKPEAARLDYNPMEGLYSRAGDGPVLDRLNRELWPFTRKGEAGYEGERDNSGAVGQVGRRHGFGKMSYPNGNSYIGQWCRGEMEGDGVYQHSNGEGTPCDVYKGKMCRSLQHGEMAGEYSRWDGATYRGDWDMGKRHGIGTFTWPDGSSYRGFWENDERHGRGDLKLPSGATFSGAWVSGKRCGYGVMKWPDGSYYDGHWLSDKRHGHGTYWTPYARGHLYVGEWRSGVKEGRGKMTVGGGGGGSGGGGALDRHPRGDEYHTQAEWLSAQGSDSQVLDGYFQGGNFIREADYAAENQRLLAEAAVAFEVDSDEERRLEEESFRDTELRFQREREMGIVRKPDADVLAAATERLAVAARRRRVEKGKDAKTASNAGVVPGLDFLASDIRGLAGSSSSSGDIDNVSSSEGSTRSRVMSDTSAASRAAAGLSLSAASSGIHSRRGSRATPRQTPRDSSSAAVRAAWAEIDRLEERIDTFAEEEEGYTSQSQSQSQRDSRARVLENILALSKRYTALAGVYLQEDCLDDAVAMRRNAEDCVAMHANWTKAWAGNSVSSQKTGPGVGGNAGGNSTSTKVNSVAVRSVQASTTSTTSTTSTASTASTAAPLVPPLKAEGKRLPPAGAAASNQLSSVSNEIGMYSSDNVNDDDDDDDGSRDLSGTARSSDDALGRRASIAASASALTLATPRKESSAEIQRKWLAIDALEGSASLGKGDFFTLSRTYAELSDLHIKGGPGGYRDAIETRERAIQCLGQFADFPKNASRNEKEYYLSLTRDVQRLRDELARQESGSAHGSTAAAARLEIQRILHDKTYHAELAAKEGRAAPAKEVPRDKNGYKIHYPHDYDNFYG